MRRKRLKNSLALTFSVFRFVRRSSSLSPTVMGLCASCPRPKVHDLAFVVPDLPTLPAPRVRKLIAAADSSSGAQPQPPPRQPLPPQLEGASSIESVQARVAAFEAASSPPKGTLKMEDAAEAAIRKGSGVGDKEGSPTPATLTVTATATATTAT